MSRNIIENIFYGVAYGSNLQQVIQLADSGINLKMFVWADAPKKSYVVSDVLNCIYDTLNAHGIEIPFPQQDVHLK